MARKKQKKYQSGAKYRTTGPSGRSGALTRVGTLKIGGKTYLIVRQRSKKKKKKKSN